MLHPGDTEHGSACPQLAQPPSGTRTCRRPHIAVAGRHHYHPVSLGRQPRQRAACQQRFIIRMSVEGQNRRQQLPALALVPACHPLRSAQIT